MKTETKEQEYPEIEGCQYICQQDQVVTVQNDKGEPEDNYLTRSLYMRNDDSVFFIKTRQWRPWWNSDPVDTGDEALPNSEAALQWAVDVAEMNPIVAARLIVGVEDADADEPIRLIQMRPLNIEKKQAIQQALKGLKEDRERDEQ